MVLFIIRLDTLVLVNLWNDIRLDVLQDITGMFLNYLWIIPSMGR